MFISFHFGSFPDLKLRLKCKELYNPEQDHAMNPFFASGLTWEETTLDLGYESFGKAKDLLMIYAVMNMIISKAAYKQWASEQPQQVDQVTLRLTQLTGVKFSYPPYR